MRGSNWSRVGGSVACVVGGKRNGCQRGDGDKRDKGRG